MSCEKCKKKTMSETPKFKSTVKWMTIGIIIWTLLGLYGLMSLIFTIKSLF